MDFEHGMNVILISPRQMGKTSLVKHVQSQVDESLVKVVYIDIYDCRSEYDFYNRFAEALMKQTASHADLVMRNIKDFLVRISPKVSFPRTPLWIIRFHWVSPLRTTALKRYYRCRKSFHRKSESI